MGRPVLHVPCNLRSYYHNQETGAGKSFVDEMLDVENKRPCPAIRYWTTLMGTIAPFNEGVNVLNRIVGCGVSIKQAQITSEEKANEIKSYHKDSIKNISLKDDGTIKPAKLNLDENAERTIYLETDGCHIPTLKGWKECKTLLLFETVGEGDKKK